MRNCPNCNQELQGFHLDCPNCGYQLVTPEQAQSVLKTLDKVESFMLELDMSPEGIKKTATFINSVTEGLTIYQNLLVSFFEQHKKAAKEPRLVKDKQWGMDTKMCLAKMNLMWIGEGNENFNLKAIKDPPSGCFIISQRLGHIVSSSKQLLSDYENFLNYKDPKGMEKSKVILGEISENLDFIWAEVGRLHKEIDTFLKSA